MLRPAYVGLGSNLDGPAAQVRAALQFLATAPWAQHLQASRLYGSRPLGGREQPDYCNAVAAFLTTLPAAALLAELHGVERHMGREQTRVRWASRRIDLDLLLLGGERCATDQLTLPHPGIVQRNFVLYPLAELAPDLWVPGAGRVATLARAASNEGIWVMGTGVMGTEG